MQHNIELSLTRCAVKQLLTFSMEFLLIECRDNEQRHLSHLHPSDLPDGSTWVAGLRPPG